MDELRSTTASTGGSTGTAVVSEPATASRRLLEAVRTGDGIDDALAALAALDDDDLAPLREHRATALAFWINVYNAATQILLARHPGRYDSALRMVRFFGTDAVTVGGESLSLDDIEHGLLRGSRSKYGLGYLPRLADSFERRYRLDEPDVRVHFALNCGAASCPAIRRYEPSEVDDQLETATETYLGETVAYDADAATVHVPRVFFWYRGDFETPLRLCKRHGAVPDDADPSVSYRPWDWSQVPGKFA